MSICVISGHWSELERQGVHFSFHSLVVTEQYDALYAYIIIGPLTSVSIFFEVKNNFYPFLKIYILCKLFCNKSW